MWHFHGTLLFLQVILCQRCSSEAVVEEKRGEKRTRAETGEQDLSRDTAETAEIQQRAWVLEYLMSSILGADDL